MTRVAKGKILYVIISPIASVVRHGEFEYYGYTFIFILLDLGNITSPYVEL